MNRPMTFIHRLMLMTMHSVHLRSVPTYCNSVPSHVGNVAAGLSNTSLVLRQE